MRRLWHSLFGGLLAIVLSRPAMAAAWPPLWGLSRSPSFPAAQAPLTPGEQCRAAIAAAAQRGGIPPALMAAIGRVESGRADAAGRVDPWPWSINAEGVDHVYQTKADAIAAVRGLQARGVRSIDVGCMQVNLMYHPDAFASLEDAFDPASNAAYAARFLTQLRAQTGNWATATAWYHSATPELGAEYQRRVMAALPSEQGEPPLLQGSGALQPRGAFMLSNHPAATHVIPLPAGASGRGLASYRARPVGVASWLGLR